MLKDFTSRIFAKMRDTFRCMENPAKKEFELLLKLMVSRIFFNVDDPAESGSDYGTWIFKKVSRVTEKPTHIMQSTFKLLQQLI